MVVIRLARFGKKGSPVYRLTVADKAAKLTGKYIEKLGTFTPSKTKPILEMDMDRYQYWIQKGAQPSPRVTKVLKDNPASPAAPAARKA